MQKLLQILTELFGGMGCLKPLAFSGDSGYTQDHGVSFVEIFALEGYGQLKYFASNAISGD